jgi:tRNA (adenine22-N1)-methyltransferase
MKKPLLDVRLATVKEQIEPCDFFADIGSDHAYLPICLLTEGIVRKAYITDVRRGPLANSRKNAQKYGVSGRCEFLLETVWPCFKTSRDILSVCGMGGKRSARC